MPIAAGSRLGPCEIESLIGVGGMPAKHHEPPSCGSAVQKRTLIWVFSREIRGNGKTGRWRERRARFAS
jgi:hypothetical protein